MSRKTIIVAVRLIILALIAGLLWYGWHEYAALQWKTERIASLALTFERPPELATQALSVNETSANIAYRGTLPETVTQPYIITVRSEDGLRIATSLSKQELVPMVLNNSEKAFPDRFPEFGKSQTRQYELDGHKVGEIDFTYKNPAGSTTQQRFVVIDKDGNTAIYLAFQAKESDFDQLNQKIFQRMIDSIQLR